MCWISWYHPFHYPSIGHYATVTNMIWLCHPFHCGFPGCGPAITNVLKLWIFKILQHCCPASVTCHSTWATFGYRVLDLFNALNLIVASVLPCVAWLWLCNQKCTQFSDFQNTTALLSLLNWGNIAWFDGYGSTDLNTNCHIYQHMHHRLCWLK